MAHLLAVPGLDTVKLQVVNSCHHDCVHAARLSKALGTAGIFTGLRFLVGPQTGSSITPDQLTSLLTCCGGHVLSLSIAAFIGSCVSDMHSMGVLCVHGTCTMTCAIFSQQHSRSVTM